MKDAFIADGDMVLMEPVFEQSSIKNNDSMPWSWIRNYLKVFLEKVTKLF